MAQTRPLSHATGCVSDRSSSPYPTPSPHSNTATCAVLLTACSTWARCQSSTKTTPSRPTKSGSASDDRLSALIANIVVADALVLLTDVDALYTAPPSEPGSKRISRPNVEDSLANVQVGGTGSNVGTGGMVTKMEAARVAAVSGIPAVLTCASNAGPAMMGDPVGTAFAPINNRGSSRSLWIGFAPTRRASGGRCGRVQRGASGSGQSARGRRGGSEGQFRRRRRRLG